MLLPNHPAATEGKKTCVTRLILSEALIVCNVVFNDKMLFTLMHFVHRQNSVAFHQRKFSISFHATFVDTMPFAIYKISNVIFKY